MHKRLHILNGDGTAHGFKDSGLAGETLIWREALCDGPIHMPVGTDAFFRARENFVVDNWGAEKGSYEQKFIVEFHKLKKAESFTEIVLWFEHDLFCQVNMLAVLAWFAQNPLETTISLICPGEFEGVEPFYGLGQLNPVQMASLFPSRQVVDDQMLAEANDIWELLTDEKPDALNDIQVKQQGKFPFLQTAIQLHLRRFPAVKDGLNVIERFILEQLRITTTSALDLFKHFSVELPEYGFGDLQFFAELKKLIPDLVEGQDILKLSSRGRKLLDGEGDRMMFNYPDRWLGAYQITGNKCPWRFQSSTGHLIFKA